MVAMAAALWMALPQVKAQTVNQDFDPGIMYIIRNEGVNINFQEGNEWEITFTALDTLGNEYYSPVGMELKGGVYGDSSYVVLQTVDSILMYQPEPVMQAGVFVITEEYFPYIAQVDSNTTIHFYADVPLPLPAEDQKVVCNTFKEPLRLGFVGTVMEKRREGNIIVMVCDPTVKSIRDFYQELIYCGKGGETAEEEQARQRIERTHRMRRGVVVKANDYKDIDNPDIELPLEITIGSTSFPAGDGELPDVFKKGQGEGKMDGGITVSGKVKGLVTIIANERDEKMGLEIGAEAKVAGKAGINGSIGGVLPLPFSKTVSKNLPFNSRILAAVGFFLRGKAEFALSASSDYSINGYLAIQRDSDTEEWDIRYGAKNGLGDIAGLTGELSGQVAYSVGALGEVDFLNKETYANFGLYLDGMNLDGKLTWDLNLNINEDKPEDLYGQYKAYSDGNRIVRSSQITCQVETKLKGKDVKLGGTVPIAQVTYNLAPELSIASGITVPDVKQTGNLQARVKSQGKSLFPADVELWVYDEGEKLWAQKVVLGKMGALDDSDFDFTANLEVEKGHTYTFCPVYKPLNSNMHISQAALMEKLYIPYHVEMTRPTFDNHTKLTLRASYEQVPGARAGFIYTDGTTPQMELEPDVEVDGTIEVEVDMPWTPFRVMAFVEVDGKKSLSEEYEMKPLLEDTPILLPPTNITYNSATFSMKLSDLFDESSDCVAGFEYWADGGDRKYVHANMNKIKDGVVTATVNDLNVMTDYTVIAYLNYKDTYHESLTKEKFTTTTPIDDITVTPSYHTAEFSAVVVDEYSLDYVSVELMLDKAKNFANATRYDADTKVTEKGIAATYEIDGLDMNTTYYYKVKVVIRALDQEFYSDVLSFTTQDGLAVTNRTPTVKSTSATLKGRVSEFVLDAIKQGTPYSGRFYFSKSKSSVTACKSDYIDVSITGTDVKTDVEGLMRETKYYTMFTLELEGETVSKSEIKSFTTPDPYEVTTQDAFVEDATVTLAGVMTLEAYDEIQSDKYNTIYAGIEYALTKEALMNNSKEEVTRLLEVDIEKNETDALFYRTIDLEPGTFYYYRAFIYVDGKDYPANIKTFQTLEYDGGLIPLAKKKR